MDRIPLAVRGLCGPCGACLLLMLGGCAQVPSNVVFMTKSSLGIDLDATAQSASVAYDRVEGYYAPRYNQQETAPVYASIESNGKLVERKLKQIYATGSAAKIVSAPLGATQPAPIRPAFYRTTAMGGAARAPLAAQAGPGDAVLKTPTKSMFFGTGTVFGFKLGFGPAAIDNFTLGYKRKELSIIPQDENANTFPSVMASFDSDTEAATLPGSKLGISQFFATGAAADGLASNQLIHAKFQGEAVKALAEYREDERLQRNGALLSLACLSELDEAQAAKVWTNVEQLALFPPSAIAKLAAAPSDAQKRTVYSSEIGLTPAISKTHTGLMLGHQVYVCGLRSKT